MDNYIDISIQSRQENTNVPDNTQDKKTYFQHVFQTGSEWASYIGNSVENTLNSLVSFGSYPKEHVQPHVLPTVRSDICDYSGKSEGMLYVQYMPYDCRYGIVYGILYDKTARIDCHNFCKERHVYPISMAFLSKNSLDRFFYAKSGGCKNWSIVHNSTTIFKNEFVIVQVSDGIYNEFVTLKTLCFLNDLDYKQIIKILEIELQEWYGLTTDFV